MTDFLTMNGITEHLRWAKFTETVYISPEGRTIVGYAYKDFPSLTTWIITNSNRLNLLLPVLSYPQEPQVEQSGTERGG